MRIIDHGEWIRYNPNKPHPHAPLNTMYLKRKSDGMDWYQYVHPGRNFSKDSTKVTVGLQEDGWIGMAATKDPLALFPMDHRLLEVFDNYGGDVQKRYGGKVYDPVAKEFNDRAVRK